MTRSETNASPDTAAPAKATARSRLVRACLRPFVRDEDGAMIVFGIMMFTLMLAIGGLSFDLMRFEAHRERLQSTLDRAVLAAASLSQTLDPKTVVLDYFAKAGMSDFISPEDVTVTQSINFRRVEARARIHVPLHHGGFAVFGAGDGESSTLLAEATSIAEESIGDLEISMVLDVSGSMRSYNRLTNLKVAAKNFIDTVYDASDADGVSTSIIPYATQVNAGATLLSHWNRTDSHEYSHCLNFSTADFSTAAMPATTTYQQTVDFDPWTNEYGSFDLGDLPPDPVCPGDYVYYSGSFQNTDRRIIAWQNSKTALKTYIDGLKADGNTSTDIGTKWGAALLDPSTQPVLTSMVGSGDVPATFDGRPYSYTDGDALKVLVVMTDGAHTSQYYMGDFRSGNSFVWRYVDNNGKIHYSIWWDGANSAPDTNPDSGKHTFCNSWSSGYCQDWRYDYNPKFWFHAVSYNGSYNVYDWRSTPFGGVDAVQITWEQLWSEIPPEYFSDEVLWEMEAFTSSERNQYEYAIDRVGSSTKNTRFDAICAAAKSNDVIVFTIGLEVTSSNATRLSNCASSPSHYYNVDNLDIGYAFQSIATQINQLRLIQ